MKFRACLATAEAARASYASESAIPLPLAPKERNMKRMVVASCSAAAAILTFFFSVALPLGVMAQAEVAPAFEVPLSI